MQERIAGRINTRTNAKVSEWMSFERSKTLLACLTAGSLLLGCGDSGVEEAKRLVEAKAKDPSSAQYRNIVSHSDGTVCGEVNFKNGFGGYAGFESFIVYTEHGVKKLAAEENLLWVLHLCAPLEKRKQLLQEFVAMHQSSCDFAIAGMAKTESALRSAAEKLPQPLQAEFERHHASSIAQRDEACGKLERMKGLLAALK